MVSLGGLDIYFDRARTIETAFRRLETLARIADESVSGRMRTLDLMLRDVASEVLSLRTEEDKEELLSYMKTRVASLPELRTISATDPSGTIILTSLPDIVGFDASQRPYFTDPLAAQDRDRLFIHGPITTTLDTVVLFVSRAKVPQRDAWDGVVFASLPPAFFASIMESVKPDTDGFAALLGRDGIIMARAPDQEAFAGRSAAQAPGFMAHVASGENVTRVVADASLDAKRRLIVLRTPEFSELMISVGWTTDAVLATWRNSAMIKGTLLLFLAVVGGVLLRRLSRREAEILDQRNFARQLVETASVMVVGCGPTGKIRLFNAAAEALTGYHRNDVVGQPWLEMLEPTDDLGDLENGFRRGQPMARQFVSPMRTKDGNHRVVAWSSGVVSGNPDIVFMAFGLDLTERLNIEQQLEASQRFLKAIADNLPGMIGYWDADLRCRFANKVYRDWFGKDPEDILGQPIQDLMGETLFKQNEPFVRDALRGQQQTFERTLEKADGSVGHTWAHYIPDIDGDGNVVGFFVLVNDITPLKETELQLRETSERLALATKAGRIGVWSWDVISNQLHWDDSMYALYGTDRNSGDLAYDSWRHALHPDDLERAEADVAATVQEGKPFDTEFRIVLPDDEVRYIKAAASPGFDDEGKVVRVIGVNWDITVLRKSEQALKIAQEHAELASRAKSEFLANMSHEIRTPMNAILGLSYLLERSELPPDQRAIVTKIGVAGRSLLSVINDILDFSKVEAGQMDIEAAEFSLNDLLDAIATIMSIGASVKDLELLISAAPDIPATLIGDATRLQQVLINLVSNAIKFTEAGEVSVSVEREGLSTDNSLELRFSVKDTGIGIAPDAIPSLFDAFAQADTSTTRRFGGSGLGLTISKRLVELMGGRIGVDSSPGRGSTFWLVIPFLVPDAAPDAPVLPAGDPKKARDLAVLIVDDHQMTRESIAVTATSLGWAPEVASSGEEALERAHARSGSRSFFDVMVLDWKMPGLDGLSVTHRMRGIAGMDRVPTIMMVRPYDREAFLSLPGAGEIDTVLVKPVTASSLYNAVMEARSRQGGSNTIVNEIAASAGVQRLAGVRLLLVEDNSINQDVARRILELEGADVTVVENGQQAVDHLATAAGAFDAVLMDIQMPVMDGYEATRHIRDDLGMTALPIIALTAGALDSERERAKQAGMDDFVAKPFDVDKMVQCIRRCVPESEPAPPSRSNKVHKALEWIIEGIDMRQAALRVGGDSALFASLVSRLHDDFGDAVERVRDHLSDDEPEAAARLLHTVSGAAGNLAAKEVASLARTAEAAIRDGKEAGTIHRQLDALDRVLGALCKAIVASGILEARMMPSEAGQSGARVSREEIAALIRALNDRSMAAMDLFNTMRPGLSDRVSPDRLAEIAEHMDHLRFEAAAATLKSALEDMENTVTGSAAPDRENTEEDERPSATSPFDR